ncbi:hypothetical protein PLICRDRAFT_97621 [Plicaturopsis crispa FD-325 SS-3]|nr:hypothetical protein PLICRDRAFT_97621 [Plicaturopsis crispa FD-325 SS-3]
MFRNLASTLAAANNAAGKGDKPKAMAPSLRADIYTAIEQTKNWVIGGIGGGQAGDGVSFRSILPTLQKHFPETKIGMDTVGQADGEIAVVVGAVTNMILEMSKWEGNAGAMTMRTWLDALVEAHSRASGPEKRKRMVAQGITGGVDHRVDLSLLTREFAARIQILSLLKSLNGRIYGAGSEEARQGEALWSSKLI